jgi:hypothetical protein
MRPTSADRNGGRSPRSKWVLGTLAALCCLTQPLAARAAETATDESLLEFLGRGEDDTAAFGEYADRAPKAGKAPGAGVDAPAKKATDNRSDTGKVP